MQYRSLVSSIPTIVKLYLKEGIMESDSDAKKMGTFQDKLSPSRAMYWHYIERYFFSSDPTRLIWNVDLQTEYTEEDWQNLLSLINKITTSTKMCYLQYKIINCTLITNIM